MKIYAKQVPPEYQESPLFDEVDSGLPLAGVIIHGNKHLRCYTTPEFDLIEKYFNDMVGEYCERRYEYRRNGNGGMERICRADSISIAELLKNNGFVPSDGGEWSITQCREWRMLIERCFETCYYSDNTSLWRKNVVLPALELMTGHKWEYGAIYGCSQGEWQGIYFRPDLWNGDLLDELKVYYFNLGSEWIVHEGENVPNSPEEITGYSVYCHYSCSCEADKIKKEISKYVASDDPADVVLYWFDGYIKTPKYTTNPE